MLLINLESKHSQLMKFGQFMSYYKKQFLSKEIFSSKNSAKHVA